MLKIRLQRVGRKHEPRFRLVLTDSKNSTKSGKFLEILGNYDLNKTEGPAFKEDRIKYWISQGAQPSGTVHNILIDKKIISGNKINVLPKKSPIVKEKAEEKAEEKIEEKAEENKDETEAKAGETETPAEVGEMVPEVVADTVA